MAPTVRSVLVRLDALVTPYIAAFGKASGVTTAFARNTDAQLSGVTAKTTKLGQTVGMLPGKFGALATVGGTAFAGVGLAVAASVKRFAEFDVAMDAVAASTGATGSELEQLGDTAMKAAAETKFGAIDAARGIESLAKAGLETADIVGGGLKGALDLAAAGEIEVAEAGEIAASAMTTFGLSGRDLPHVADLFAAAAGKAQGSVDEMAMAFNQTAQVASMMGLSIEETTGTLAAFASTGLIGSDAGTSFRTMLIRLANPTGKARDLMEELGLSAYDAQGAFVGMEALAGQLQTQLGGLTQEQRNAALATIFGNDAIRAANVLYEQGAGGIEAWTGAVDDSGYAAEQAARRTDNLAGDLERLGGELEKLLITGGGAGEGPLRGLIQGSEDWIATLNEEIEIWETRYLPAIGDVEDAINDLLPSWLELPDVVSETTDEMERQEQQAALLRTEVLRDHAAADRYTSTLETTAAATAALAEETDELRQEAFDMADQFLSGRDAARDWEQAIDDAAVALEENGATLDISSQKGRDNEEALDRMADAALRVLEDMVAAGENTDVAQAQMREALVQTGIRMGMSEQDAEDYAEQILLIPKAPVTTPRFEDTAARVKVASWQKLIKDLSQTIPITIRASGGLGGLGGFFTSGSTRPGGMPWLGSYPRTQGPHDGGAIDYGMPVGTPLRATFPGYLDNTNLGNRSYGMYYTLRGGGKYELGAHLSRFARGDGFVSTGSLIGWSGNTGNSTGPHVHLLRNFAKGGMISHAPVGGSVPINAHGGEYVVNAAATAANRGLLEAINTGRSGGGVVLEFRSGGSHTDDLLLQLFRKVIRVNGGNVQTALGS
jgi:TP901 family phage tail tape measure protein